MWFTTIVGWACWLRSCNAVLRCSLQAHQEALKASSPEAAAFMQKLLAALEVKMVHAKFGKY